MRNALLIPIIGHGATDILSMPKETIIINIVTGLLIKNINLMNRKNLLLIFSVFHIAQDLPIKFKYIISIFIHILWLKLPIIAKLNLLFIHTPIHYYNIYKTKTEWIQKYLIGILTSIISGFFIKKNIDIFLNKKLGELWWISPVITHIIITEMNIKNITLF